jgi:hypothetical protein
MPGSIKSKNLKSVTDAFHSMDTDGALNTSLKSLLEEKYISILTQTILQEGLIGSGPDDGPGPKISTRAAWNISVKGNGVFDVSPTKTVWRRVAALEYGTGVITPKSGEYLRFKNEDGEFIYVKQVDGVRPYAFIRTSVDKMTGSNIPENHVAEDIEEYISTVLRGFGVR